jgi:ketosteroid isomerase-like protein
MSAQKGSDNAEFVRGAFARFNELADQSVEVFDPERDAPELWEGTAPDFELHERPDLPDARVYVGREEAKEFWRKTWEIFSTIHWRTREVIDRGDVVIAVNRIVGTGRESNVEVEMDEADLFWFRDGLLVRLQAFGSREEALAAAEAERAPDQA